MKKIVSTLLIMFLTIMTLNINSYAAGLSASNNASANTKVGDTVTITVSCGSAYGLDFNMNLTGLSFVSGSVAGGFVSGGNSKISAMSSGTSPFSSVTLVFNVTAAGTASCSISNGKTYDTDGGTVSKNLSTSTSFKVKSQAEIDAEKAAADAAAKAAAEEAARQAAAAKASTSKTNKNNKSNTNKKEEVKEEEPEEVEEEVQEENVVEEQATNEVKEEVVETPKKEKKKFKINFDDLDSMKLFMFVYAVILTIIAVAEAIVITKRKDGKRGK